jgi:CO dehydrogenase nickel-insertion accessory protein CooC1
MESKGTQEMRRDNPEVLAGKRIGILGKGGAGKSTLTIFLGKVLYSKGYEVCLLDADSTNVGMHLALGLKQPPTSLLEYYGGMVFSGGAVTCPVDDPTPLPNAELSLDELPSQYVERTNGIYLLTAGKIGDLGPGAGCDGPISKIARDLVLHHKKKNLVTLVDFKAGFEDSARGAITSLDWALIVVDPTNASIEMASHMQGMVDQMRAGKPPATEHLEDPELVKFAQMLFKETKINRVLTILNRVKDAEMEQYLRMKLKEKDLEPISVIHEDPTITTSWLKGTPLTCEGIELEMEAVIQALESRTS